MSAASFTNISISLVGQGVAPEKCVLLSSSRGVRADMVVLVTTWTVKRNVRDLGGHLNLNYRGGPLLYAREVGCILCRTPVVYASPLDNGGKLRILRTIFIPAALRGAEASAVFESSLCKLRSAFVRAWSGRLSLILAQF